MTHRKILILASGQGGTTRFLLRIFKLLDLPFTITGVIADRKCGAIDFAEQVGLYSKVIEYHRNQPDELISELKTLRPDLIITNFHKIIDSMSLSLFPDCFINLHYSLLPAFAGVIGLNNIIDKAKKQNVRFMGGTSHIVDDSTDGGKIIQQFIFPVDWQKANVVGDTIFKGSCLALLGALFQKSAISNGNTDSIEINNFKVEFSPSLPISSNRLKEVPWNNLLAL